MDLHFESTTSLIIWHPNSNIQKAGNKQGFRTFESMIVYADTSTIGGCFDDEFEEWSIELFKEFKAGVKLIMLSDLTLRNLNMPGKKCGKK